MYSKLKSDVWLNSLEGQMSNVFQHKHPQIPYYSLYSSEERMDHWISHQVSFRFCGAATNYNSTRRIKTQCLLCIKIQKNTGPVQWFEEAWLVATGASVCWKVASPRWSVCKRKITPLPNLDRPAHLVQPAEGNTSPPSLPLLFLSLPWHQPLWLENKRYTRLVRLVALNGFQGVACKFTSRKCTEV